MIFQVSQTVEFKESWRDEYLKTMRVCQYRRRRVMHRSKRQLNINDLYQEHDSLIKYINYSYIVHKSHTFTSTGFFTCCHFVIII